MELSIYFSTGGNKAKIVKFLCKENDDKNNK